MNYFMLTEEGEEAIQETMKPILEKISSIKEDVLTTMLELSKKHLEVYDTETRMAIFSAIEEQTMKLLRELY